MDKANHEISWCRCMDGCGKKRDYDGAGKGSAISDEDQLTTGPPSSADYSDPETWRPSLGHRDNQIAKLRAMLVELAGPCLGESKLVLPESPKKIFSRSMHD